MISWFGVCMCVCCVVVVKTDCWKRMLLLALLLLFVLYCVVFCKQGGKEVVFIKTRWAEQHQINTSLSTFTTQ